MATSFSSLKTAFDAKDRVTFGKHVGALWGDVSRKFPDYIIWCVGNTSYKFTYELIIDSIKNKYKLQKDIKEQNERDLMALPVDVRVEILRERDSYKEAMRSSSDFKYGINTSLARDRSISHALDLEAVRLRKGDWQVYHADDDWDEDIPF